MNLCEGYAPPPGNRRNAHRQRCGAVPVAGAPYCIVHVKAQGYRRCAQCGIWTKPVPYRSGRDTPTAADWQCANGCK